MSDFEDQDLISYVSGSAPEELSRRIEQFAETDSELAAQLSLMAGVAGLSLQHTDERLAHAAATARRLWTPRVRRFSAAAAAVLIVAVGVAWTAWAILVTHPLLKDDFNDNWLDSRLWIDARPYKASGVWERNGYLRLLNRGYLVTQNEYEGPLSIRFKWRWTDLVGDPYYGDTLAVALRTSGKPSTDYPHEAADGVVVQFNTWAGIVSVYLPDHPEAPTVLGKTPHASLPVPADEWHKVRIDDDGEKIAVYFEGPAIKGKEPDKPVLEVAAPRQLPGHKIAIYNREILNQAPKESHLDDFVVLPLPKPAGSKSTN